jgi:hypothetical protein
MVSRMPSISYDAPVYDAGSVPATLLEHVTIYHSFYSTSPLTPFRPPTRALTAQRNPASILLATSNKHTRPILDELTNHRPVFAGKDASRALAKSSKEPEDVKSEWQDLDDSKKGVLDDWITFFSKRYNIVGVVKGATNME